MDIAISIIGSGAVSWFFTRRYYKKQLLDNKVLKEAIINLRDQIGLHEDLLREAMNLLKKARTMPPQKYERESDQLKVKIANTIVMTDVISLTERMLEGE